MARARVRALAAIIGCDIHPLHNVGPVAMLRRDFGGSDADVAAWLTRWIGDGLAAVDALITGDDVCFGTEPGLADVYLVPQVYAARRFGVPIDHLRRVVCVEQALLERPAFQAASPARQPDAEPT